MSWVRSYTLYDTVNLRASNDHAVQLFTGRGITSTYYYKSNDGWAWIKIEPKSMDVRFDQLQGSKPFLFFYEPGVWVINVPHWLLVLIMTGLAVAPWIRWRFSLRLLLLITTLMAVVLATAVFWSKS